MESEHPMRKLCYMIAGIALLGIGVGAGVFIQRKFQVARIEAAEQIGRDLIGLDAPLEPAPAWESWAYPGADSRKGGHTGETRINEEIVVPSDYHGVWTTPDTFEDVIEHYATLLEFEEPGTLREHNPGWGGGTSGGFSSEAGPASVMNVRDNGLESSLEMRPVRVECLARRTRAYTVTVFISRADDENLTHIIVLYSPLTETL